MNFIRLSAISICVLLQFNLLAAFARVVEVRGKVSQLAPGSMKASWIKKGQLLKEDTSIVTRLRSFTKIEILADGSYIVVGPNSKVELTKIEKKSGSIIQLLNGKMRSNIVPSKNKKHQAFNKAYIKTKTMALGVRGTEFVTVVSQKNQATSVITLEGEVAVKKINQEHVDTEEVVKESLDSENVTLVKKGNASTTYAHLYDETPPQKVNPKQLIALEKNENLETVARKDVVIASNKGLNETSLKELYGEGVEADEVPSNGAIVDLDSAIFIPEIKDESLKIGEIDKNTGQFVASNDIKLDEKKGFVAAKKNDKKAIEKVKKLNETIEYKEVKGHDVVDHGGRSEARLMPMNNAWQASFGAGIKNLAYYSMDGQNGDSGNGYAGLGLDAAALYQQVLNNRFYLRYKVGITANFFFRGDHQPDENDDDFIAPDIAVTAYYRLNGQFRLKTGYHLQEEFFLAGKFESSLTPVLDQRTQFIPYLSMGAEYDYSDNWSFLFDYRSYMPSSDKPKFNVYTGKGFELGARKRLSKTTGLVYSIVHREFLVQDTKVKNLDLNVNYEMEF